MALRMANRYSGGWVRRRANGKDTKTAVRAVHLRELRTALSEAYVGGGRTAPVYTDPVIVALFTPVKAVHFTELQAAVVALDGE